MSVTMTERERDKTAVVQTFLQCIVANSDQTTTGFAHFLLIWYR